MKIFRSLAALAGVVAISFILYSAAASAGNLPSWGGATTTTNQPQVQQPGQPFVSEPAPVPAQTVQPPPPSSWSPPRTTSGTTSSPSGTAPVQRSRSFRPTTRSRTAPSPLLPQTGGRALGISPPRQGSTGSSGRTETAQQDVPGKKARFRITINGFRIFAVKGVLPRRGHSYYIAAKVLKYSQWGAISSNITKATKVIGNTKKFSGAIKGGTATKNGGFRNGDTYPTSVPYTAARAYSDRLPLLVWEGVLEEGGDVVVVEPTIWEKRNGQDIIGVWSRYFPPKLANLLPCAPNAFNPSDTGYPVPAWTQQNPAPIDNLISTTSTLAEKRVCVTISPLETFRVLGRNEPDVIPGFTEKTFPTQSTGADPHGILFNYSKADMIAGENPTGPVAVVEYLKGSSGDDGFPAKFVGMNQRTSTVIPVGGMHPFWFGSSVGQYRNYQYQDYIGIENFFAGSVYNPIVPRSTAIELYLQIQKLPQ